MAAASTNQTRARPAIHPTAQDDLYMLRPRSQPWMRLTSQLAALGVLAMALVGLSTLWGVSGLPKADPVNPPVQRTACDVLTVYDGDTLGCDLNHNHHIERPQEQIRLLGIDTPEMHYSKKNRAHGQDEPFAPEASHYTSSHLNHATVYLSFDTRRNDKRGRTLAFVFTQPTSEPSFNEVLLAKGLAITEFIPPNWLYYSRFKTIEQQARQQRTGLWRLTKP
jgi:endonuclease YncB( thermonuclease family)